MTVDDIEAEADAQDAVSDEASPASPVVDVAALAEAVVHLQNDSLKTNKETRAVMEALKESSVTMAEAAFYGVKEALRELDDREAAALQKVETAERRSDALISKGNLWMVASAVLSLLMLGLCGAGSYLLIKPKIAEYQAYRDSHQVIVEGSLFGAQLREQDGIQYILFDEGTKVDQCNETMSHCITINR